MTDFDAADKSEDGNGNNTRAERPEAVVDDIDVNRQTDTSTEKVENANDNRQTNYNRNKDMNRGTNNRYKSYQTDIESYPSYYERARYKKRRTNYNSGHNSRNRRDKYSDESRTIENTDRVNNLENPGKEEEAEVRMIPTKVVKPAWMSDEDFKIQQESIQRAVLPDNRNRENVQVMASEDQSVKLKYLKTLKEDNKDEMVREFYNTQTFNSRKTKRTESQIYRLRSFNNCIKYILINKYGKPNGSILDLGCGKGGDLAKWSMINTRQYVGIDLSDESIREAIKRYKNGRYKFQAVFATGDAFKIELPEILKDFKPEDISYLEFDNVSMQFCMHYAFSNEEAVNKMIKNVSKSLKIGGMFVGTIPSSDFIKWKLKKLKKDKGKDKDEIDNSEVKWGNSVYSVTFPEDHKFDFEKENFKQVFGNVYNYYLKDAVDNVPEYVVPFEKFRSICEDNRLVLKYKKNFFDMFNNEISNYFHQLPGPLIQSLRMADGRYGVSGDEREACSFYLSFAFEKV